MPRSPHLHLAPLRGEMRLMRIAVTQTPGTRIDDWRQTLELIDRLLVQARGQRADVVLLPECVWPAYFLGTKAEFFAARAAGLPSHEHFLEHLRTRAREHRLAICAGYVEEQGKRLFNAACFFDAAGQLLGTHRKCFLWDFDHDWFELGQELKPFDTPFDRVGLMICADARLPEIPATLAARGARWLLQPTAWVNAGTPERPWNPQPDFLIAARAIELGIPVASASKIGPEGAASFVGGSLICDGDGQAVARCSSGRTEIAVADVQPRSPRPTAVTEAQRKILGGRCGMREISESEHLYAPPAPSLEGKVVAAAVPPNAGPPPAAPLFAAVSDAEAVGFAAVRCAAIEGATLVAVIGDDVREESVRARAAENRVFIAWLRTDGVSMFDPGGRPVSEIPWPGEWLDARGLLDVQAAKNKCVAPRTDVIADRRPEIFEF